MKEAKQRSSRRRGAHRCLGLLALAGALLAGCGGLGGAAKQNQGMPANVQAELQQKIGSATGPPPKNLGGSRPGVPVMAPMVAPPGSRTAP